MILRGFLVQPKHTSAEPYFFADKVEADEMAGSLGTLAEPVFSYTLEQLAADGAKQLQEANARALEDELAFKPNLYRPSIHRKRDGLLLVTCTGRGRFLTWFESLQFRLGLTDAERLERKFCRS